MVTDSIHSRATGGFTLLEVLIAMIILAVGLLGLQALTVSAVRAVGFGQQQSEYAMFASSLVEERIQTVRTEATCALPPEDEGDAPRGKRFRVVVTAPTDVRRNIFVEIIAGDRQEFALETATFVPHCGQLGTGEQEDQE